MANLLRLAVLSAALSLLLAPEVFGQAQPPSFNVSGDFFMKDGKPFRIIAAEIHFWRSLPEDWGFRLKQIKGGGYNTINVYANWALFEPSPGNFDFLGAEGRYDIVSFLKLAWQNELHAIVRVGPYITAEFDFGGFPWWLTTQPKMKIRSLDPKYLALVDRYFDALLPQLVPLQYDSYGGPIVLVQVEDDTTIDTSSMDDNRKYYEYLVQGVRKRGLTALVNTLCYPTPTECYRAAVPGAVLAVEMTYWVPPTWSIDMVRAFYPNGPIIVMEIYSGWFDCEGYSHNTLPGKMFRDAIANLLSQANASVSIYLGYGGTNYGFTNGAEAKMTFEGITLFNYSADVTSYDYDAPIHEAGELAEKHFLLRDLFSEYVEVNAPVVQGLPLADYGAVAMNEWVPLKAALPALTVGNAPVKSATPIGMEELGQGYGYVFYSTIATVAGKSLSTAEAHLTDRGLISVNDALAPCVLSGSVKTCPVNVNKGDEIDILVENKGRVSGDLSDFHYAHKGIRGNVTLDSSVLSPWTMVRLPFDQPLPALPWTTTLSSHPSMPALYRANLTISGAVQHTYVTFPGFGKGFALVNGFNIGRFTDLGPQCTYYVPASILSQQNTIVVFESDSPSAQVTQPREIVFSNRQLWFNSNKQCA